MGNEREDRAFHRPPRAYPAPVPDEQVVITAPPQNLATSMGTLLFVLFPIVGSLGIFAFALVYHNKVFLYVAIAMVAITALFAIGMRWAQKRSGKKTARRQRRRYRSYLADVEERLDEIATLQSAAAERLYPDPQRLWGVVLRRENLWERRPSDDDFLTVRLGRGPVEHAAHPRVDLGHNPLAEYEERLVEDAQRLADFWRILPDLPVAARLDSVLSVVGPPARTRGVARAMIAQLASYRAPLDLRIACAYDPEDAGSWEWVKWLPHARGGGLARDGDTGMPRTALADSPAALATLLEELVAPRLEQLRTLSDAAFRAQSPTLRAPHVVLVLDRFSPADPRSRLPLLREAFRRGPELKISVICLVEDSGDEPSETAARIRVPERGVSSFETTGPSGVSQEIVDLDEVAVGAGEALARGLAPLRLSEQREGESASGDGGLLRLLGIPSIESLDPATDWLPRPRSLELRATIGTDDAGEPVVLDLKQSAEGGMGPHGLIIGATGSGKSELLRTLIASLALTHSPEQLAFIFVDYKGGTALAELERLPHSAGMITNLQGDLALVDRMHDALYGEQKRREQLLRDAGNLDDVVSYRAARERNPDLPPLPDLLVIIDEFSELLASRPDFIDLFVAIGRVGRALGIHLLFASQRFEEGRLRGLESHLRYRICLRTYSPVESKAVIGTPDAYALPPDPGLGYLKVDTGIYQRFRGALVSRPHVSEAERERGPVVAPFAPGFEPRPARRVRARPQAAGSRSEMELLVERLRSAGPGRVHQVWLDPLERLLALDSIQPADPWWRAGGRERKPALMATVGTVDMPLEQRKEPLTLDFAGAEGHLAVVGAPQSGKSTLLRSLALALAAAHTPDEVQIHAIDLGGGLLRACTTLPHVGTVAGKGDRELVRQVVRYGKGLIEERERQFRRLGFDSIADAREARVGDAEGKPFPDVFILIDGWSQLRRDFEGLDFEVEELASIGLTYGVHLVVTAQRWGEMRPSVSDNLGSRLELRLNDPLESAIGRKQAERLPADIPGRGLTRGGHEFQSALPRLDGKASAEGLAEATAAAGRSIAGHWRGEPAPAVRVLPTEVHREELRPDPDRPGVPIGITEERFETLQVDLSGADSHLLILGDGESGRTNLLRAFAVGLMELEPPERASLTLIDPRRTLADLAEAPSVTTYATNPLAAAAAAEEIGRTITSRLESGQGGNGAQPTGWAGPHLYLLIDDYDLLAGPEGNPLAGLVGAVAHGRDVGFHVILARRVAGATRAAFEPFYQRLVELRAPGIILSGDRAEGPLLDGNRASPQPPGRGLLVRRGHRPTLVQTVLCPPDEAGAADGRLIEGRAS